MTDLTKTEYDEIMEYDEIAKKEDIHPVERKLKLYEYFDYESTRLWMQGWLNEKKFPFIIGGRRLANTIGRELGIPSRFRSSKYYRIIKELLLELAIVHITYGMKGKDLYRVDGIRE